MMYRVLALIFGALLPLSLAPFAWWPLGLLSVAGLFWLNERYPAGCVVNGWLYGVGKYGVGASWVYVSIHQFGGASIGLSVFLVALFVGGMALFVLTMNGLYGRLRTAHLATNAVLFVAFWVVWEWLLTWVFSGFPWLFVGYAHVDTVLAGFAPVGGVLFVSALACTVAVSTVVALWVAVKQHRWPWGALVLLLLPWLVGYGLGRQSWVEEGTQHQVALVQGNIDQATKWDPANRLPIVRTYLELSKTAWDADLVIWPEAAITLFKHEAPQLLDELQRTAERSQTSLVFGIPTLEREPPDRLIFHNSVEVLGLGSGSYEKQRLVPFGEYVPLESWLRGLIEFFNLPMSRSEPGSATQPLLDLGGHLAGMAICYEIAYGELVRRQAQEANVLMTVSNDTWFGASIGPHQHLQIARMRALESGRYLLRGTNNGVTAVIGADGQVQTQLPQFEPGVLRGRYRSITGSTPYVRFGGLAAALVVVLALVVCLRAFLGQRHT